MFENLLTQVMIRMEDASAIKRKLFHHFMGVARRCGAEILDGKPVSTGDRVQYWLGNLLVYGPLRNVLGMSRIRVAYTAGAAIGPDLFRFYRSIGINLKQLYGSTETCAYVCLQPDGGVKLDTVGLPAPNVEVKIGDNGEVLVRGPMLLKEYYKRPDATAESIDSARLLPYRRCRLLRRRRAPQDHRPRQGRRQVRRRRDVRTQLSREQAQVLPAHQGGRGVRPWSRDMACAFINIDIGSVGNWAERRGLAYSGYTDLAQKAEVYALVRECVEAVNAELATEAGLADSQVHRFLILHKELDPDDDELTRTRKVRRSFVAEKYAVLIDALYGGKATQHIETLVRFEDGRTNMVAADLRIEDAKTFAPVRREAALVSMANGERPMGDVILRLDDISLAFGGVKALTDVSFDVREHEVRAIIGPNGAGKSSMLNVINGVYQPQRGTITFRGRQLPGMRPHDAAARGIARTFQNIALFRGMSVLDNIMTGRNLR